MKRYERAAAYVDLNRIEENFRAMKENLKEGTRMAAVIKADGYGHGAVPIARLMEPKDYIWGFAVAAVEEALQLRKAGIQKPILILGYTFPEAYPAIVEQDLRPTVFRLDMAEDLSKEAVRQKKSVHIHVKVDTGMSRIGFPDREKSIGTLQKIQKLPGIHMEGLFTHFARADEADKTWALGQLKRYQDFADACQEQGVEFLIHHCSNSAGILELPEANLNLVRAGISLYGLYPSEELRGSRIPLRPAMEIKSHIVYVKEIKEGTQVSYGGTYVAPDTRRIATIPVGYGDGYPRSLSGRGFVLILGQRAPICGRVCMDQFMVDVTDIPGAQPGTEVTLIGEDGKESLSMEELGDLSGRFNYELACCINKRVPRLYRKEGRIVGICENGAYREL